MKLEKISDTQIRCTLTASDLSEMELKISELAYGTDKAKTLFQEMMRLAAQEFGFVAENIPIMIEAIPFREGCVILIITKVENPDELDTRFSKFAPSGDEDEDDFSEMNEFLDDMEEDLKFPSDFRDDLFSLFRKIHEEHLSESSSMERQKETESKFSPKFIPSAVGFGLESENDCKEEMFVFDNLELVMRAASVVHAIYKGANSLQKDVTDGKYYLNLGRGKHTNNDFNRICNILSEYAAHEVFTKSNEAYRREHFETILDKEALQKLASL